MPSLHSAFALFVVVFFWPWVHNPWARAATLAYPLAMAVALAYFAEHYIVDAVAGWLLVGTVFWLWNRIERSGPIDDESLDYEKTVETRNSLISAEAARA